VPSLFIDVDADGALRFRTRGEDVTRSLRSELETARSLPVVRIAEPLSAGADDPDAAMREECLVAIIELGWPKAEAERRVTRAWSQRAPGGKIEDLLREAMRR
jgi:hypothetical protein